MADLVDIIWQSLRLDQSLWRDLATNNESPRFRFSLLIVLLAGLSEAIAQSVVLFLNQVKPRRFVLSLLLNAVFFVFAYFFYLISIDVVARTIFKAESPPNLFYSIALAYAPLILGFMAMLPYFGWAISVYLAVYHFLALIVATAISYALPPGQALLCVAGGWLVLTLAKATIGRPLTVLAIWLQNRTAGTQLLTSRAQLEQRLKGDDS